MSIESAIEAMIRDAIARGDFDNLEGAGKPLNLDAYFNTPEDVRMGYFSAQIEQLRAGGG